MNSDWGPNIFLFASIIHEKWPPSERSWLSEWGTWIFLTDEPMISAISNDHLHIPEYHFVFTSWAAVVVATPKQDTWHWVGHAPWAAFGLLAVGSFLAAWAPATSRILTPDFHLVPRPSRWVSSQVAKSMGMLRLVVTGSWYGDPDDNALLLRLFYPGLNWVESFNLRLGVKLAIKVGSISVSIFCGPPVIHVLHNFYDFRCSSTIIL